MKQWEYMTLRYYDGKWWTADDHRVDIAALGQEGWEMVSVVEHGTIAIEAAPPVPKGFMSFPVMRQLYLGFFKRGIE